MKAQLKAADRSGAPVALIIGEAEAAAASVTIRDLRDGTQLTESRAAVLERTAATGRVLMEGR
jgi:histidyl-tRNA synthetase